MEAGLMPKTLKEKNALRARKAKNMRDMRAKNRANGIEEVRSIMAPLRLHSEVKQSAREFIKLKQDGPEEADVEQFMQAAATHFNVPISMIKGEDVTEETVNAFRRFCGDVRALNETNDKKAL
jgi:hypothetical protein